MLSRALSALIRATPNATKQAARGWSKLSQHVFTLGGFAAIDYGVFQANTIAGWISGGVLLLVYGALIDAAREDPPAAP